MERPLRESTHCYSRSTHRPREDCATLCIGRSNLMFTKEVGVSLHRVPQRSSYLWKMKRPPAVGKLLSLGPVWLSAVLCCWPVKQGEIFRKKVVHFRRCPCPLENLDQRRGDAQCGSMSTAWDTVTWDVLVKYYTAPTYFGIDL